MKIFAAPTLRWSYYNDLRTTTVWLFEPIFSRLNRLINDFGLFMSVKIHGLQQEWDVKHQKEAFKRSQTAHARVKVICCRHTYYRKQTYLLNRCSWNHKYTAGMIVFIYNIYLVNDIKNKCLYWKVDSNIRSHYLHMELHGWFLTPEMRLDVTYS